MHPEKTQAIGPHLGMSAACISWLAHWVPFWLASWPIRNRAEPRLLDASPRLPLSVKGMAYSSVRSLSVNPPPAPEHERL